VFEHFAANHNAAQNGLAHLNAAVVRNQQCFKTDFGVHIGFELFNHDLAANLYLILLTTGLNDCIHDNCTSSYQTRPIAVARIKPRTYTAPERLTERS
jgi:hypothetical protein